LKYVFPHLIKYYQISLHHLYVNLPEKYKHYVWCYQNIALFVWSFQIIQHSKNGVSLGQAYQIVQTIADGGVLGSRWAGFAQKTASKIAYFPTIYRSKTLCENSVMSEFNSTHKTAGKMYSW